MNFDNILFGFTIILLINSICIYLVKVFSLPVSAPLLGMLVLSALLFAKAVRVERIKDAGTLLLENMGMLFIPPAISIILYFDIISNELWKILLVVFLSSIIVMLVSGKIVQVMLNKAKGGEHHE